MPPTTGRPRCPQAGPSLFVSGHGATRQQCEALLARSELARLDLNSAVVSNVHRPVGRSELLRRGHSLESVPGRLLLLLCGVEILG